MVCTGSRREWHRASCQCQAVEDCVIKARCQCQQTATVSRWQLSLSVRAWRQTDSVISLIFTASCHRLRLTCRCHSAESCMSLLWLLLLEQSVVTSSWSCKLKGSDEIDSKWESKTKTVTKTGPRHHVPSSRWDQD